MGKKKQTSSSGFIDKKKAITFALISRDNEDPNYRAENQDERVFRLVKRPNPNLQDPESLERQDNIIDFFSDQDQGIFERKGKLGQGPFIPEEVKKQIAAKQKMTHKLFKKNGEDEEDYPDLEDYDEFEIEENEEYEEEEDKNDDFNADDYDFEEEDEEEKKEQDFPQTLKAKQLITIEQQQILKSTDVPDYSKNLSKTIKMKKFNEYGLPIDQNYNYDQHFADKVGSKQGETVAVMYATNAPPKIQNDEDTKMEEMNDNQKEVYEAMNDPNEGVWEDLEDDFIQMAQDGDQCINLEQQEKKVKFVELEITEDKNEFKQKKQGGLFDAVHKEQNVQEKQTENQNLDFALKDFDETEEEKTEVENTGLTYDAFDKILDDHIKKIPAKENDMVSVVSMSEGSKLKNNKYHVYENAEWHAEDKKSLRKPPRRQAHKDQVGKEMLTFPSIPEEDLYKKQHFENADNWEQDQAMVEQLDRDDSDYTDEEIEIEAPYEEEENIATKSFNQSTVHERLNMVVEEKRQKIKSEIQSQQVIEEEEKSNILNMSEVSEVFAQRNKNETPEERKERKAMQKEFKDQRREKKRQFKEAFQSGTNEKNQKIISQTSNQNLKGVSTYAM